MPRVRGVTTLVPISLDKEVSQNYDNQTLPQGTDPQAEPTVAEPNPQASPPKAVRESQIEEP